MGRITVRIWGFIAASALVAASLVFPNLTFAQTDETVPFQGQHEVSPALLAQAQQRISGTSEASLLGDSNDSLFPSGETLGLSTTGKARAVVIRVDFPASEDGSEAAETIPENETDEDLFNAFNGPQDTTNALYPYESLHAYYERSSFGKLDYQATEIAHYTTQHPRSYYASSVTAEGLFIEALNGVDDQIDFSQADANNDGYIDAIYLQFAGACGKWSSVWWPHEFNFSSNSSLGQLEFDGKHACATVMFPARTHWSDHLEQMLIHETGHVLGLPDLYRYIGDPAPCTGTFDMMDNNTGDQNGLFKWLLGWITPEDITYVLTTSKGVDVRIGTGEIVHYDDAANVDLTPYTSDVTEETGGFVAVSPDETILSGNLFTSFFLLQFDHAAGNQKVSLSDGLLGHGIRAFRVQASLNTAGTNFEKNNNYGKAGNRLFESLVASEGRLTGEFLHEGALVSPNTQPSTNYYDSQEAGYTGVTFEITEEQEDSAQVKFSWTAPSERRTFELTPTGKTTINGFTTLNFTPTWMVSNLLTPESVELVVDGTRYAADGYPSNFRCSYDDSGFHTTIAFNPGVLKSNSSVEIVVPAGFFDLGFDGDEKILSDEIRIPLQIADLTSIEASGNYEGSSVDYSDSLKTTDIVTDNDGHSYFFQATWNYSTHEKTLKLLHISEDGSAADSIDIDASAFYADSADFTVQAIDLGNGTAFLHSTSSVYAGILYGQDAWIDLSDGNVLAIRNCGETELYLNHFAIGSAIAFKDFTASGLVILKYGTDGVTETYTNLKLPADVYYIDKGGDAGDGLTYMAYSGSSKNPNGVISFYRNELILADGADAVEPVMTLTVPNNRGIYDVKISDGKIYIACEGTTSDDEQPTQKYQLLVYSFEGELLDSIDVSSASGSTAHIKFSDQGMIAWLFTETDYSSLIKTSYIGHVIFINPQTKAQTELGVAGPYCGTWIGNRWLEVGPDIDEVTDAENPNTLRHWSLTAEMKVDKSDSDVTPDPDATPNPGTDTKPNSGATKADSAKNASKLPSTGAEAPLWMAVIVAVALIMAGLATVVRRK